MLTQLLLNAYPMTAAESVRSSVVTGIQKANSNTISSTNATSEASKNSPAATVQISDAARSLQKKAVGKVSESQLSQDEKAEVQDLKKTDREVRQHESAHLAAAGGNAKGGPTFEFTQGPDGNRYAVGGEVDIDTSPEKTPEATLQKARQIRGAALAPASPSGQDRSVASAAAQMEGDAQRQIANGKSGQGSSESTKTTDSNNTSSQTTESSVPDESSETQASAKNGADLPAIRIPSAYNNARASASTASTYSWSA